MLGQAGVEQFTVSGAGQGGARFVCRVQLVYDTVVVPGPHAPFV